MAVLARMSAGAGRRPGHLERTYRDVFNRFAVMLSEGAFPFPSEEVATEEAPRVGDGVVLVDEEGRVRYASPNATNALHRMGMYSQIEGRRLTDLGIEESAIEWALASALPVVEEVERRPDVTVLLHCIPLIQADDVTGCIVLLRDVTDVRRLDRLLLSKDAAIREVHHRVKNNLQTISALLRLQARRLPPGGGRVALFEAERRVRSIAIVHEILSREPSDQVPFDEIVTSLIRMAEDSVVSRHLTFEVTGALGEVPADVATPLAVVLAELVQNAIEHAFLDFEAEGDEDGGARRRATGTPPGPSRSTSRPEDGHAPGGGARRRLGTARRASTSTTPRASGCPSSGTWCGASSTGPSPCANRRHGRLGQYRDGGGHRAAGPGSAADRPVSARPSGTASRRTDRVADGSAGGRTGSRPARVGRASRDSGRASADPAEDQRSGRASGGPATGGQPGLAQLAALLLGGRSPHPDSWLVARAKSRQVSWTSQLRQTRLADSIWSTAGPVVPMGKNRSGSVLRQAANCLQSPSSHSTVRFHMRATLIPPLISPDLPSCDLFHIARR